VPVRPLTRRHHQVATWRSPPGGHEVRRGAGQRRHRSYEEARADWVFPLADRIVAWLEQNGDDATASRAEATEKRVAAKVRQHLAARSHRTQGLDKEGCNQSLLIPMTSNSSTMETVTPGCGRSRLKPGRTAISSRTSAGVHSRSSICSDHAQAWPESRRDERRRGSRHDARAHHRLRLACRRHHW
jgi:hypothetical protein